MGDRKFFYGAFPAEFVGPPLPKQFAMKNLGKKRNGKGK
jgi:hypothetical protein